MKDLGEERRRGRSPGMLLVAVGLAIGAGVLASVLKPPAGPTPTASGGIAVPVPEEPTTPDPTAHRAQTLERLVSAARTEPKPQRLPEWEAVAIPCRQGRPVCAEAVARLGADDVPPALVIALARELPRGREAQVDALLAPLLDGDDADVRRAALDVYRQGRRAQVATDAECRCGFGMVALGDGEAARTWLFAESRGAGLAWAPAPGEDGWTLALARAEAGPTFLAQRVDGRVPMLRARQGAPGLALGR